MKVRLFLAALAIVATAATASTQDSKPVNDKKTTTKATGAAFVDKNNNGICDNKENGTNNHSRHHGNRNGKGNGHGKGNGQCCGSHNGKGSNFIDKNANGICDNQEARSANVK